MMRMRFCAGWSGWLIWTTYNLPRVTHYDLTSGLWAAPPVEIAVLSDLHVCAPWTPPDHVRRVVEQVQDLQPDLILLPGDFLVRRLIGARPSHATEIATALKGLSAPLGVFASLGNHDWKDCPVARRSGFSDSSIVPAFRDVGLPVLINEAVRLPNGAWLVGFDSQQAQGTTRRPVPRHEPARAFASVPEGASVVLMAHEPDCFLEQDHPAALQISGHTHAGQIAPFGWRPVTPSRYGGRLAYGVQTSGERHVVVSAGLGYTGVPLRIGAPPEIVQIRLSAT